MRPVLLLDQGKCIPLLDAILLILFACGSVRECKRFACMQVQLHTAGGMKETHCDSRPTVDMKMNTIEQKRVLSCFFELNRLSCNLWITSQFKGKPQLT